MKIGITMMSHDTRLGGPGTETVEVVSRIAYEGYYGIQRPALLQHA